MNNETYNNRTKLKTTQTFRFPSAVILNLLQVPQKCSLIEVMKPIEPTNPGTRKDCMTKIFHNL